MRQSARPLLTGGCFTGGTTAVPPDIWVVGEATGWSDYFPQTLIPPGGGTTYNGWATKKYTYFGTLQPGRTP